MRFVISLLLGLAVLVLAAVFGSLNDQPVTVNTLLASYEMRLAYVLLITFLAGCLGGVLLAAGALLRMRLDLKRARGELALKDKELTGLRTLPVRDAI